MAELGAPGESRQGGGASYSRVALARDHWPPGRSARRARRKDPGKHPPTGCLVTEPLGCREAELGEVDLRGGVDTLATVDDLADHDAAHEPVTRPDRPPQSVDRGLPHRTLRAATNSSS